MMDEVINVISTVGFPIAACIYMAHTMCTQMQKNTDAINRMSDTLNRFDARLDKLEDKIND